MIILEGPDGGGKTRLLEDLRVLFPEIPVAPRFSSSGPDGGPVRDLFVRGGEDIVSWTDKPVHFYDRHPFVSEYIYGPVVRGHVDPRFHTSGHRRRLAHRALTVLCLPSLEAVRSSVSAERDMSGVAARIDTIWQLYASLRATWPNGGTLVHYDYEEHDATRLIDPIRQHLRIWSLTR